MRYVAYYRVSTDRQGQSGLGLDAQKSTVQSYLSDKNPTTVREFTEVESGRSGTRPKLKEALALCRALNATLIVAKLDRLTRNSHFLGCILESGVQVIFLDLPQMEPGPVSKFFLQQMANVAELEAGLISQRTKAALKAAKARGVRLGGDRGYRPPAEQSKRAAQAKTALADDRALDLKPLLDDIIASGKTSYRQIANELNERNVPTPSRQGNWQATTVSRIMARLGLQQTV